MCVWGRIPILEKRVKNISSFFHYANVKTSDVRESTLKFSENLHPGDGWPRRRILEKGVAFNTSIPTLVSCMLKKLTPEVNFTNILSKAFRANIP